ncbi:MAG: hypothetical protein JWL83_3981 [Actinomycetia bacterium]|nr:hypothetical protein [Actinomycetes bacterium]
MRRATRNRIIASAITAVLGVAPAITFLPALLRDGTSTAGAVVADGREVGFSFYGGILANPRADVNADFDRAKATGATWVRLAFNWSTLEMHGKGQFNWGPSDALVSAANARGLKIDAVVSYAPFWARPGGSNDIAPPTNSNDYGDFLAAATARYAPLGVHTWEIWNEPNLFTMWSPKPDIAKYTSLLKAAYPRIHAIDSSATVLTGGTSPAWDAPDGSQYLPLTFLKGIYANGGKGYFDAVGHHPSTYPYSSNLVADWSSFQQSKLIYSYMVSQGDGAKKIWATEIGFPTGTDNRAVSELNEGKLYAESLEAWTAFSFHGPMFIYSVRDEGTNLADHYQNFGIMHVDGTPKAGYTRIVQALRAPQHVAAQPGTGNATVSWDPPGYDYGAAITAYTVTANPGGASVTVPAGSRTATVPVSNSANYTFTVQPVQNGVPGVTSVASNVVMPGVPSVYPTTGSAVEGNSGTRILNVPVVLSKPSTVPITVHYTTGNWAPSFIAAMPQDYDAASGTLTFAPGVTELNVAVTIKGDTVREVGGDSFLVFLSNPTNASIGGFAGVGVGHIVDDD